MKCPVCNKKLERKKIPLKDFSCPFCKSLLKYYFENNKEQLEIIKKNKEDIKMVDKKEVLDYRGNPKKSVFTKKAEAEVNKEEKEQEQKEKKEMINKRAEQLRTQHEQEQKKIVEQEQELSKLKVKRMNELALEDFLNFNCPKCKGDIVFHFSQRNTSILIWGFCTQCDVVEPEKLSFDEAKIRNFPVFYTEIKLNRFFNFPMRSEERRVGKECRSRGSPYD